MLTPSFRLLIIDDQPASVNLLLDYLAGQGVDVMVALDGHDGIAKAVLGQPDLVLLDLKMPHTDGLAVCRLLKSNPATETIPVLFLTAATDMSSKLQGFAAGAVDYITKPFFRQEVLARIFIHMGGGADKGNFKAGLDELAHAYASSESPQDKREVIFNRALAVLRSRLDNAPTAAELARELGSNERWLNALFRERVGMSAFEYLLELRLDYARELLKEGRLQIQLIGSRIGYRNAGDFSRAFRQRFGVSPREYRDASRATG